MLPSQALLLLCHLDNDLVTIIYIYTVVHMTMHKPENLGAFCLSHGTPVWPWPVRISILT